MNAPTNSGLVGLARIYWMMAGPLLLFLLILSIAEGTAGWFTAQDVAFLLALAALMFARWFEFHGGDPRNAVGEPIAPTQLRKYLVGALTIGAALWIVANLVGQ